MAGLKPLPVRQFYRTLRLKYHTTGKELAELVGVSERSIRRFVVGKHRGKRYRELVRFLEGRGWDELVDLLEQVRRRDASRADGEEVAQ
jgi:predicted transcriptional regulator